MKTKEVSEYLELLDISESDAALYLTLLGTGPLNVPALANSLGMKSSTTYDSVDRLTEKGLVTKLVSGSRAKVVANPPNDALTYLAQQKIQVSKKIEDKLPQILTMLHKASSHENKKTINEAEIKFYKGKNGVKKIYEEALQSKELRSYANLSIMEGVFPENLYLFSEAFKNNLDLKMYEIVEDSPESRKQTAFSSKNPHYFYKFLPKETELSAADILIYDGKVAIINVRGQITGVVLQNSDYYSSSRELFDLHWKDLPEVER